LGADHPLRRHRHAVIIAALPDPPPQLQIMEMNDWTVRVA